jgi:hypothetical protein
MSLDRVEQFDAARVGTRAIYIDELLMQYVNDGSLAYYTVL